MNMKLGLRPSVVAVACAALFAGSAFAQTTPPATTAPAATAAPAAEAAKPEPDFTFTGNVGLFSQYVFRGVTQTDEKPAIQGGFDLGHKSGLYAGTWASNISWLSDGNPDVSAPMEWDFYGGYKWSLPADFVADFGVLYYWYPGTYPPGYTKPNTTELYAALNWKMLQVKYSYSPNNTFGVTNSDGSYYVEGNINWDIIEKVNDVIGKVTLIGHVGYQDFKGSQHDVNTTHNNGDLSYTDWKVGASTELWGVTVGIFGTGTNASSVLYTNRFGKNTAANQFVGYVQKTF
jgi:uncharacterized protein (TIGR02001 family)